MSEVLNRIMERIGSVNDPLLDVRNHIQNSNVPLEKYTKSRFLELGRSINARKIIYLDQNFWINLREAKFGHAHNEKHLLLYKNLSNLCRENKVICPISFSHYAEILRQADRKTRLQTAELMDELCCGFALCPPDSLSDLEMVNHLMGSVLGKNNCHKNDELAWIYSGYVAGVVHPSKTAFDAPTELAIQKMLFEHSRYRTLRDTIELMDDTGEIHVAESDQEFQLKQTEECGKHRSEYKNFKECYLNEIFGCVDLYRNAIVHAATRIWEIQAGKPLTEEQASIISDEFSPQMENAIRWAFKLDRVKCELPCLDIPASCHSIKRYKQIPFKKGDQHDFMHARIALPYCSYFLTERVLGEMLCDKLISLDKKYQCKIMWNYENILDEFSMFI